MYIVYNVILTTMRSINPNWEGDVNLPLGK